MGRKINPITNRLDRSFESVPGLLQIEKIGLGRERDGSVRTGFAASKSSYKRRTDVGTLLTDLVEHWVKRISAEPGYDGTFILTRPVRVLHGSDRTLLSIRYMKIGPYQEPTELARPSEDPSSEETSTSTPAPSPAPAPALAPSAETTLSPTTASSLFPERDPLTLSQEELLTSSLLRQLSLFDRSLLSVPVEFTRTEEDLETPSNIDYLTSLFEGEEFPRVSKESRVSLFYSARRRPLALALAQALAFCLEDTRTGEMKLLQKFEKFLHTLDRLPELERSSRSCGYEIVVRGTIDGARRSMKKVITGGKLSRGKVSLATSSAQWVAVTKTGTRGLTLLCTFAGDLTRESETPPRPPASN